MAVSSKEKGGDKKIISLGLCLSCQFVYNTARGNHLYIPRRMVVTQIRMTLVSVVYPRQAIVRKACSRARK